MGNKRIYLGRELSKYAKIAGGAIITITSLFFVLMAMGFEITGSDDICLGTLEDPCISYGRICNLGPDNFDIYNPDEIKLDFSPTIKNYWIFFKDGRVKKQFLYEKGINASTTGWRYENFTNATKPRKDRIYVHRFARYSCQEYMLVGLKENPYDVIKWGVGVGGEYLDPWWYGENESEANISVSNNLTLELGSRVNITTNLSGATKVCVDIDHPDYGDEYICGSPNANFLFNISFFRKTELNNTNTTQNITYAAGGNQTIYIQGHQYDELVNLTMNLTGYLNSGEYPENVKIYINNTLSNTVGPLRPSPTTTITIDEFNDSSSTTRYINANGTVTKYLKIPKEANITSAKFNYTGLTNWTGSSFYGQVADAEANDCTEEDCGDGGGTPPDDQTKAYDSDNSTYAYSYSCGSDTGEYSDYQLNYTHNITNPAKTKWELQFEFDAYDSSSFRRIYYAQCYDYDTSAWINIDQFTLYGGNPSYEKMWYRSYTLTNEGDQAGCLTTTPMRLRAHFTKVGGATYCSTIEVFELDTKESSSKGVSWWNSTSYPQNMTIEVGAVDGTWEGNQSGEINSSYQTDDFNDTITSWLSTCTADSDGYCYVPVYSTSDGEGKFKIHDIEVNYTYDPNPIVLDISLISSFLSNESNFSDIPITIYSNKSGIVEISDIRYDYKGGNDTIEVFTWDKSINYTNSVEDDTEDGVYFINTSGSALFEDIPLCYDENWATEGGFYTKGVDSTTAYYQGYIYENYTIPSNTEEANITYKYRVYHELSCLARFYIYCKSESDGAWVEIDHETGADSSAKTETSEVSSTCLDEDILMTRVYIAVQDPTAGPTCDTGEDMWANYYESKIYWYNDTLGDKSNNDTLNLLVYFSDFFKNLPYTWTEHIFFLPRSNSSKNVSAYGQTTSIPLFNITTTNYGGMNMNLSIKVNETFSCLNISWNATGNTKPTNQKVNTTWQEIATNLEYLNNTQIWLWADLDNCNASDRKILNPEIYLESYCKECIWN